MCSSSSARATPYSRFLRTTAARSLLLLRCGNLSIFRSKTPNKTFRLSASLADKHLDISWFSPPAASPSDIDNYKGWDIVEKPPNNKTKGTTFFCFCFNLQNSIQNAIQILYLGFAGLPTILIGGIGTCAFALLAAIGYISLSRKGRLCFHISMQFVFTLGLFLSSNFTFGAY